MVNKILERYSLEELCAELGTFTMFDSMTNFEEVYKRYEQVRGQLQHSCIAERNLFLNSFEILYLLELDLSVLPLYVGYSNVMCQAICRFRFKSGK